MGDSDTDSSRIFIGSISWWILVGLLIIMFGVCMYLFSTNRLLQRERELLEHLCYRKRSNPNNHASLSNPNMSIET